MYNNTIHYDINVVFSYIYSVHKKMNTAFISIIFTLFRHNTQVINQTEVVNIK